MIFPYEELPDLQQLNFDGKKVGVTIGGFERVHRGHIECLDYLRSLVGRDGIVVVGLWGDAFLESVKGPGRPVVTAEDRAVVMDGLRNVDVAFVVPDPQPDRFMGSLAVVNHMRPDVFLLGGEPSLPPGSYNFGYGSSVDVVEDPTYAFKRDSTTAILRREAAAQASGITVARVGDFATVHFDQSAAGVQGRQLAEDYATLGFAIEPASDCGVVIVQPGAS